jgi:hypothetical protein
LGSVSGSIGSAETPLPAPHASDNYPPPRAHDGICQHSDGSDSVKEEINCILETKSFADRRDDTLRLKFRNGGNRSYKNSDAKACEVGDVSCKQYELYDYFPEHEIFLVHILYYEDDEWLLIRQQNGKEEKVVAPPHYSPSRIWLASVYATDGAQDANGIDIVPSKFDSTIPSWHYRPNEYEQWYFVRWNGDNRLTLTVMWRAGNKPELVSWPAEVVYEKGAWRLNRRAPTTPAP